MDHDWLKDFLALAEHRTFSRAADARHVTQPAFSRRIRALEDWTGTRLFERTAQGAELTEAGTAMKPLIESIVHQVERARDAAREAGRTGASSLSIAATHALSFTFFPEFIRRHLDIADLGPVNLVSDSLSACERSLAAGEVHFMIAHYAPGMPTPVDMSGIESRRIGTDKLVALCAPDAQGAPRWQLEDAAPRLLAYSEASGLGRILAANTPANAEGEPFFTSHLAATLATMAREGHGIAWLPLTLVEGDIAAKRLVRAGNPASDVPVDIRIFRSRDCRNRASDALWKRLTTSDAA